MILNPEIEGAIVKSIPELRAGAISLCRNRDYADELVQETLARAIAHIGDFDGANLGAWLFTIMRNNFYNECRRSKRARSYRDGQCADEISALPDQVGWCVGADLRAGLETLSSDHRQALFLVGASGLSYEAAAAVAGCRPGTMKSRVCRARKLLAAFMSGESGGVGRGVPRLGDRHAGSMTFA